MVALPQKFKTEEIKTVPNSNVCVPDGTYIGVIISGEMSPSPFGQGKPDDLLLKVAITQGEKANTIIEHRLGISDEAPIKPENPTFTWSRAAYGTLGQIADAFGMPETPADTNEICNKPISFTTATRLGKDKTTGQPKPEWSSSYIKTYQAVPANGLPEPVAEQAAAVATVATTEAATPQTEATATAGAPVNNPFAA